jgi:hypothetical protein
MLFTPRQLANAARRIAIAERTEVVNKMLMTGIKPTDEDMEKLEALANLAIKSGAPDRFLSAAIHHKHSLSQHRIQ